MPPTPVRLVFSALPAAAPVRSVALPAYFLVAVCVVGALALALMVAGFYRADR